MKPDDKDARDQRRELAGRDGVRAEARADRSLFDDGEIGWKRAGAQQDRQIIRRLRGEIAGNLAGAAENGLADLRRRDNLIVENDGEQPPDILLCRLPEAGRALPVETERDHRLIGALVECCLRVHEILAGNDHPILDQVRNGRIVRGIKNRRSRRRTSLDRVLDGHRLIDHLEGQLGCLSKNVLEALRVLEARHLNENAVYALPLDDRLGGAELVDAPPDHLDGLGDRRRHAVVDAFVGEREPQQPGLRLVECQFRNCACAEQTVGDWLGERLQRFLGFLDLVRFANTHLDGPPGAGQARVADLGVAQHGADVVAHRLEAFVDEIVAVDRKQDVRSALQVEAKGHRPIRQPAGQAVTDGLGQHIRDREEDPQEHDGPDGNRLPT